ncbi:MAG: hypothetical protein ABR968_05000 [Bacteroidales bacterium]|jgi:hypothetical protein
MIAWYIIFFLTFLLFTPLLYRLNKDKLEEDYPKIHYTHYLYYESEKYSSELYLENLPKIPKNSVLKFVFNLERFVSDCFLFLLIFIVAVLVYWVGDSITKLFSLNKNIFNSYIDIAVGTFIAYLFLTIFIRWVVAKFHFDTIKEIKKKITARLEAKESMKEAL